MLRCLLALLGLFACSSALVVPAAPLVRSVATPARSSCPSMELAHRKGHVPRIEIEIEQGEPIEKALRRFRKQTNQVGHLRILRNRKTFESAHDKQIRKAKESAMRKARERRSMRARNN